MKNVYAKQLSILGDENETTLTTAHYIADRQFYLMLNVNKDVLQWCTNVIKLKTEVFGPLHKSTLLTKRLILTDLDFVKENNHTAVKFYEECFQWQMTHLGANKSETYIVFKIYVVCLLRAGKHEKARCVVESYLQEELAQCKHGVYYDLLMILLCLKETDEDFLKLRRLIIIGKDDDEMLKFSSVLAEYKYTVWYTKDGNYSEALKIYKNLEKDQYCCDLWWTYVQIKISQFLIEQQDLETAQFVLHQLFVFHCNLFDKNSEAAIETKKLLDDINSKIAASKV